MDTTQRTIRIVLADDHPLIREGLANILSEHDDLQVVGEVAHGRDLERTVEELEPDVLVLDLRMPELKPEAATRRLKERYPELKVLVLTAHDDPEFVVGLLLAGASGYALKDEATDTLVDAIRTVAQGRSWLTDKVAAQAIRQLAGQQPTESRPPGDALESLTPREQEILALIGIGASNAQIADRLSVSKRTVENHVSSIYAKLRLSDRIQLAMYAINHGLVDRLLSDRSDVGS